MLAAYLTLRLPASQRAHKPDHFASKALALARERAELNPTQLESSVHGRIVMHGLNGIGCCVLDVSRHSCSSEQSRSFEHGLSAPASLFASQPAKPPATQPPVTRQAAPAPPPAAATPPPVVPSGASIG